MSRFVANTVRSTAGLGIQNDTHNPFEGLSVVLYKDDPAFAADEGERVVFADGGKIEAVSGTPFAALVASCAIVLVCEASTLPDGLHSPARDGVTMRRMLDLLAPAAPTRLVVFAEAETVAVWVERIRRLVSPGSGIGIVERDRLDFLVPADFLGLEGVR